MRILNLIKTLGIISAMSLSGGAVYASGDHAHNADGSHENAPAKKVTEKEAGNIAKEVVKELVAKKKLKDSWLKVDIATTTKKKFKDDTEWVVTLTNDKGEKDKKTLYVFLSLTGGYLGANFSGK